MIGDLVGNVGLVEFPALELSQLGAFVDRLAGQGAAGVIVLRRDLEFLDEVERLLVDGLMSRTMSSAKDTTSLFLDFDRACFAAVISSWPAVYAMCAICGSVGLAAVCAAAAPLSMQIAAVAALSRVNMRSLLLTDTGAVPVIDDGVLAPHWMIDGPKGSRESPRTISS